MFFQATMLKKMKGKMKRRNTEPFMQQGAVGPGAIGLSIPVVTETSESVNHNNDF